MVFGVIQMDGMCVFSQIRWMDRYLLLIGCDLGTSWDLWESLMYLNVLYIRLRPNPVDPQALGLRLSFTCSGMSQPKG